MARIRTIKPQFFLNEELAELPAMVRLLFIGLWTQADREGRLIDRPKRLKAEIFPYENFDMEKGLKQLSEARFIVRYKANANVTDRILAPEQPTNELAIIQIVNFSRHQKIDKANEKDSELPAPLSIDYNKTINSLPKDEEGKGKEGKGMEGSGEPPTLTQDELEFNSVVDWMKEKCPRVLQMKEPLTKDEYFKLKARFEVEYIPKILQAMHNWSKLTKDKVSAYLTFLAFAKRDQKQDAA
jgi:hypothetical protein